MTTSDNPLTTLAADIRAHWERHRPQMVARLRAAGQYDTAVARAVELTEESVLGYVAPGNQGQNFWVAWELFRQTWAFLPAESDLPDPMIDPLTWGDLTQVDEPEPEEDAPTFSRGPFGEILPPPLLAHLTPHQALLDYEQAIRLAGGTLATPRTPAEKQARLNRAMASAHRLRLLALLSDSVEPPASETENALRESILGGDRLSLRPLGLESWHHPSFAPVVFLIAANTWQIGLPEYGRADIFDAPNPQAALTQAYNTYRQWAQDEETPAA